MGQGRELGRDDDPARVKFPTLWDLLSRVYIGIDRVRQPASVSITLGPEGVNVSVTDRDLAFTCAASCQHVEEAFSALEKILTSDVPPIRSWGRKEPKLRKRNTGS